jgi:hypothetical protein
MDKDVRQQAPSRLDLTQGTRNWRQKDRVGDTHKVVTPDLCELLNARRPPSGLTQLRGHSVGMLAFRFSCKSFGLRRSKAGHEPFGYCMADSRLKA